MLLILIKIYFIQDDRQEEHVAFFHDLPAFLLTVFCRIFLSKT